MKHIILVSTLLSIFIFSCKQEVKGGADEQEAAQTSSEAISYQLDSIASIANWKGYKITDGQEGGHFGTLQLSSTGNFTVQDGHLQSGDFEVVMGSLVATDLTDPEEKSSLEAHLLDPDFLDAKQFPLAKFQITKVTPLNEGEYNTEIQGNFTIKGNTKNYTFQANTSATDSTYTINTQQFSINREEFGISYQSTMKNVAIKDNIDLQIVVVGNKQ